VSGGSHGWECVLTHPGADSYRHVSRGPDPARQRELCARVIDRTKVPAALEESVRAAGRVGVEADDLALRIDPLGVGHHGAGEIDGRENEGLATGYRCGHDAQRRGEYTSMLLMTGQRPPLVSRHRLKRRSACS